MSYLPRLADSLLDDALERAGAVLIEGPKASGKTETASRRAASAIRLDTDPTVAINLNDFYKWACECRQALPELNTIKHLLPI